MSRLIEDELVVELPSSGTGEMDQDQEYCEVQIGGQRRRIRFHDYGEIFSVPGLYERLFVEMLECDSPQVVAELLQRETARRGQDPTELRALDFGAGNGMVGEELRRIGADEVIGLDLLEEAKAAAERDRPDVYDDYHALDITELDDETRSSLQDRDLNCLTCVAALGFGDVPPGAFAAACDVVSTPAWVAFNIRERFLDDSDGSGFATLLRRMFDEGVMVEHARRSYPHRLSVEGEPIHYVAVVAEKRREIPRDWV